MKKGIISQMKLAFIATRGKKRIEVILDDYLLWKAEYSPSLAQFKKDFSVEGKYYPRVIESTQRYQELKKFYTSQGYKIRAIISAVEQKKFLEKHEKELKNQKPKLFTETVMGVRTKLAEDENDEE